MSETAHIPFREVPYLPQKLNVERRGDAVYLSNGQPLKDYQPHMLAPLKYWAEHAPDRVWLAQRDPVEPGKEGWQELTYHQGWTFANMVAQALLDDGAGQDAPALILSRNTIEHAYFMYGAMLAGSPVVPVTPAYALLSKDYARLKYIIDLIQPKFIYVEDGEQYAPALKALDLPKGCMIIYERNESYDIGMASLSDDLMYLGLEYEVNRAYDALTPQTVAKYMLTSGSTGEPKAVINTHEMIAANAKMIRSVWDEDRLAEVTGGHQIMCNFLPWSHTYGANAILHNMLDWGGTLYLDWGAPTPARLPEMIRNLSEVSTTQHTTVPAAWAALATEFERDETLAETFFKRICSMAYGGAAMGQDIYERIQKIAVRETGRRISLSAGYGATETAPTASNVHWPNDTMGLIGLPLPGNTFKLVPNGEKQELRVKGVNVTPGYFRNEEKTREAFDEEGYYKLGDAVRFVDPEDPNKGLAFDGRTAEEFKLANGTWVSAGKLRVQVVQAVNGALSDVVVCGLNETDIRLLGFLNEGYCQRLVGEALPLPDLAKHPKIIEAVETGLRAHNTANPNASARIACIKLQVTPPQPDSGEITEKGYLNQNKVQTLRKNDVTCLYQTTPAGNHFCI